MYQGVCVEGHEKLATRRHTSAETTVTCHDSATICTRTMLQPQFPGVSAIVPCTVFGDLGCYQSSWKHFGILFQKYVNSTFSRKNGA